MAEDRRKPFVNALCRFLVKVSCFTSILSLFIQITVNVWTKFLGSFVWNWHLIPDAILFFLCKCARQLYANIYCMFMFVTFTALLWLYLRNIYCKCYCVLPLNKACLFHLIFWWNENDRMGGQGRRKRNLSAVGRWLGWWWC